MPHAAGPVDYFRCPQSTGPGPLRSRFRYAVKRCSDVRPLHEVSGSPDMYSCRYIFRVGDGVSGKHVVGAVIVPHHGGIMGVPGTPGGRLLAGAFRERKQLAGNVEIESHGSALGSGKRDGLDDLALEDHEDDQHRKKCHEGCGHDQRVVRLDGVLGVEVGDDQLQRLCTR